MFEAFLARIAAYGVIPVVTLGDSSSTDELAGALIDGGLPVIEVTLRTSEAPEVIRKMSERGDLLVGAGTVRTLYQAKAARDSGASYLVCPGFNETVVDWAIEQQIPILPGVDSTLGIEMAVAKGISALKFFPAEASGGLARLDALHGPYADVWFVPTGGIDATNLAQWLARPAVLACGGSWLLSAKLLNSRKWAEVKGLAEEAIAIARHRPNPPLIPSSASEPMAD